MTRVEIIEFICNFAPTSGDYHTRIHFWHGIQRPKPIVGHALFVRPPSGTPICGGKPLNNPQIWGNKKPL